MSMTRRTTLAALLGAVALPVAGARAAGLDELRMDWATYNPVSIVLKEQGLIEKEFAADNILVNTVCIGKIKSGQHERRYTKAGISADEYYAKDSKTIPLGRFGEAAEAANVIVFLCSAAASYVTGTSVNLDGGMSGVL